MRWIDLGINKVPQDCQKGDSGDFVLDCSDKMEEAKIFTGIRGGGILLSVGLPVLTMMKTSVPTTH